MKKIIKYIFAFTSLITFVSCSTYNKVYNRGTVKERYALANQLYKDGQFKKAQSLYELVEPYFAGKTQAEVVNFRLADAAFKEEDFITSIHYYERFIQRYPNSTEIGNAQYRIAQSYFELSPKHSVSQEDTQKAIDAFQSFIDNNPDSDKIKIANQSVKNLNFKLEKKAFEIAKQYYKIGFYKSAIVAFDNVILDFLGTSLKEEAMFYKLKSAYKLGINSIDRKKQERVNSAIKIYDRYHRLFPDSKFESEATYMYDKLISLTTIKSDKNS